MNQIELYTPGYANLNLWSPQPAGAIRRVHYAPSESRDTTIDESLLLDLSGAPTEIEVAQSTLEKRLELIQALLRRQTGSRSSLQVIPAAGQPAWNSPLTGAWLATVGGDRLRGSLGLELHLQRLNYWEAASEAAVPISNRNLASTTCGLTVWNHCDSTTGHDNWISILGSDIGGELPAALKLEVLDLSGMTPGNKDLIVAQSIYSNPVTFAREIECGGNASGLCSNSDFTAVSVSSEAVLLEKDLPTTMVQAAKGGYFKPLLKLKDSLIDQDVWLKLAIVDAQGQIYQDSCYGLVPAGEHVIELGIMQIPPRLAGLDQTAGALKLELRGKKASGSATLNIDYLLLAPLDGFRRYTALPETTWKNAALVDDGFQRQVYQQNTDGTIQASFNVSGEPLRLVPGLDTCFTFQLAGTGISQIDRQMRVKLWYKPRKRRL